MNTYPENDFELDFKIDAVKKVLELLLNTPGHTSVEINSMLNTYKFGYMSGLFVGIIKIQLSSVGEEKTKLHISTMPASGSNTGAAILTQIQDKFLKSLTGYLSGSSSLETLTKKAAAGKGCLLLFAIIMFSSIVVSALAVTLVK